MNRLYVLLYFQNFLAPVREMSMIEAERARKIPGGTAGGVSMQKWEYMVRKTDFKALTQPSFLELERTRLTEHGEEGWELVSAIPSQNGEALIMFLKRPAE